MEMSVPKRLRNRIQRITFWPVLVPGALSLCGAQKTIGILDGLRSQQKSVPVMRSPGEYDVTGKRVFADKNLRGIKSKRGGQAHGLAAPVGK